MKPIFRGIFILLIGLTACRARPAAPATPTQRPPSPTVTASMLPTASPTRAPTHTPVPATATARPTAVPPHPQVEIRTHPDGGLFVGDQVSFEVLAPPDAYFDETVLQIWDGQAPPLEAQFTPFGIGGRDQATVYWGWDTRGLEAGPHALEFSLQPLGYTWTQTVTLGSALEIPPPEARARWATDESDCCVFYYVTDTAAAREITATLALADELAAHAAGLLESDFTEPLLVTLMPRVLGQGGFASSEIYISFLDRNYAGSALEMVLHHEMVHILDYRLGGAMRPTILIEGLAVYLTGGHYKPETLIPRAAALLAPDQRADGLGLGWYLPLGPLSDDFYNAQHEISYIQAGALVEYMVATWGWAAYTAFYRDIHPIPNGAQSDALDAALQSHFEMSLAELEADFIAMLREQAISAENTADVRLTVELLEAMRRYQQALDPSAYFLTAWLPNGPLMREKGIVADLVRRPTAIENLTLETLLVAANQDLRTGDFAAVEAALAAVNAVLAAFEANHPQPFEAHPLAKAHFEITTHLWEAGYQAEQIDMGAETATVTASQGWPELTRFTFNRVDHHWDFAKNDP